jgi:hypothetical protein
VIGRLLLLQLVQPDGRVSSKLVSERRDQGLDQVRTGSEDESEAGIIHDVTR